MKYNVYNHNMTLLGSFDTKPEAEAEASFYMVQTGNVACVLEEDE